MPTDVLQGDILQVGPLMSLSWAASLPVGTPPCSRAEVGLPKALGTEKADTKIQTPCTYTEIPSQLYGPDSHYS